MDKIRNKKPADIHAIRSKISDLYKEECGILIEFAELRLDGKIGFEFDLP